MGLRIGFAVIAICLAGTAQAQNTVSNDDQATIRFLVQQVHELQAKVTALEATQSSPSLYHTAIGITTRHSTVGNGCKPRPTGPSRCNSPMTVVCCQPRQSDSN